MCARVCVCTCTCVCAYALLNACTCVCTVGVISLVHPVTNVTGCLDGINATIDVDASLLVPANASHSELLSYNFTFREPDASRQPPLLTNRVPFHGLVNPTMVVVTNKTSVALQTAWLCGRDAFGVWELSMAVRDNSTSALVAYNDTTVQVTSKLYSC